MLGFLWARICSQKVVRIWADQGGQSFLWRSREAGREHLCSQQRVHPFARDAEAEEGGRGAHLFTTLFSPREGAEAASAREPEEHAALCGHLHPPDPRLHLLDPVSLRCLHGQHRLPLGPWSLPSRPFKPQDNQGTGAFLPNPDTGAGHPVGPARLTSWSCCGAWVSRRTVCWFLPQPKGKAIKNSQAAPVC